MFGREKHVYTCPDVIYLRQKAKRNNRIILAMYGVFVLGSWIALIETDRKDDEPLTEDTTLKYE